MKVRRVVLALAGVAVGAVVVAAPRPAADRGPTIAELTERTRSSGLHGKALVEEAIRRTAAAYEYYSAWHLWESAQQSLAHRHGWSHQYNAVLRDVLRGLGFRARLVHSAWTRGTDHPWWHRGHTWVQVEVDGRMHDACASRASNQLDELPVTAVSDELLHGRRTRVGTALFMAPFVVWTVWKHWVTGRPMPAWIHGRRTA